MKRKPDNSVSHQYNLSFDEIKTEGHEFQMSKAESEKIKSGEKEMTREERTILRFIFQNKIFSADGQKFEDLFTAIMKYAEPDFQQIKPYGSVGDKKNDGYIKSKGIYFQVYGPENIANAISYAKTKLKEDFSGLIKEWSPVNEFYYIINDKYKGIPPELEIEMNKIIEENKIKGGVKGAGDLENLLFSLADDQIMSITSQIPDPSKIKSLNYTILNEVIGYIMGMSLAEAVSSGFDVPDWNEKITFNKLSPKAAQILNNGSIQIAKLDEYLMNQGNFLGDGLRDKINEIYLSEKEHFSGDELFWRIVSIASPRDEQLYQTAVIVIMAKYFEACDIFERPPEGTL